MSRSRLGTLRFKASPKRLQEMRAEVTDALDGVGLEDQDRRLVVLAVSEACMNVIQHGYKGDPDGEMVLEILNNGGLLEFRLTDFAETVDPATIEPRPLDELRPGGLGVHFIRCVMDDYRYTVPAAGKGNLLIMRKRVKRVRETAENAM
jgi:sigma-B regulation protein RsbU (phosphoserine phosphatase)